MPKLIHINRFVISIVLFHMKLFKIFFQANHHIASTKTPQWGDTSANSHGHLKFEYISLTSLFIKTDTRFFHSFKSPCSIVSTVAFWVVMKP